MVYLFDTNALSEAFRRRPNPRFVRWLADLPADRQFTSTIVMAELFVVAYRSESNRWLDRIREVVLPVVHVIHFDVECAEIAGRIQAELMNRGEAIESADVMIAATAIRHRLTLVTANIRHYDRVPGLETLVFQPGENGAFTSP